MTVQHEKALLTGMALPRKLVRLLSSLLLATAVFICVARYQFGPGSVLTRLAGVRGQHRTSSRYAGVDWRRFAYIQYATDAESLCSAVVMMGALHGFQTRADLVLLYSSSAVEPVTSEGPSHKTSLLEKARDDYGVKLVAVDNPDIQGDKDSASASSIEVLAYNQTQYERVLFLNPEGLLLQHMDDLFLLPPSPVSVPRAYWRSGPGIMLSSHVLLVQPSFAAFTRIAQKLEADPKARKDRDTFFNDLYSRSALVLPHRPYLLPSSEFRVKDHKMYLGRGSWDANAIFSEAKYIHLTEGSSEPVHEGALFAQQPSCGSKEDCPERDIWYRIHDSVRERRQTICSI